ncbi:MAG: ABC transporter substrate-binding protein [Desulfobacteraceae bacterium]|nr:ABC transporter substrate-binding protein [Desulfobacteraceae bacterium]
MKKSVLLKLIVLLFFLLISLTLACPATADQITAKDLVYITEEYPPHNFYKEGILKGASIEILSLIWEYLGLENKVEQILILPWARGIKRLGREPNIVLFAMGYSPERAQKYHWVGAYHTHSLVFIAKKSKKIKLKTILDAQYYQVGAVREDIGHHVLAGKGFEWLNPQLSNNQKSLFLKLKRDRLDMISYMDDSAFKNMHRFGLKPQNYEIVYEVQKLKSGFGFSKKVPISVVGQFQGALDQVMANGSADHILEKYDLK